MQRSSLIVVLLISCGLTYSLPSYSGKRKAAAFTPKYYCNYPNCSHKRGYILHSSLSLHYALEHANQVLQRSISPQTCPQTSPQTSMDQYSTSQEELTEENFENTPVVGYLPFLALLANDNNETEQRNSMTEKLHAIYYRCIHCKKQFDHMLAFHTHHNKAHHTTLAQCHCPYKIILTRSQSDGDNTKAENDFSQGALNHPNVSP